MLLFDDIKRNFDGPASHNENTFDYYQRSARADISIIRNKLNDWFQNYPENEKHNLKSSFKNHFYDSFYELFLFQLFRNLGFKVEIHPNLNHTSKKPDFLIKRNDLELFVEAKVVKDKSKKQEAFDRKMNQFYDDFSKIKINGFLLSIDTLNFKTEKQPSAKQAINYIEKEIRNLDPDLLTKQLENFGIEQIPKIEFENDDLQIIVKPIPLIPSARDKDNIRPIGIYPSDSFWGGGEASLKKSILYKANRYGKLGKPFIVCINSLDIKTSGKRDIDNAIWGSLAISWTENSENRDEKLIRKKNGVFLDSKGPRLKHLTGVLVTKVYPHNIPNADYWLYKNPFSTYEIDFKNLGLVYNRVENGKIIDNVGSNLDEILNISEDWLND